MENGKTRMERLEELLKDLIWLNGVIATELIRGPQHTKINEQIIEILEKHLPERVGILKEHVLKHR